jgi:hypothetical protein
MVASREARNAHRAFRFGDVSPSAAAHEELWWFFNEAARELAPPTNPMAAPFDEVWSLMGAVERRAEAVHSANKIWRRLEALRAIESHTLEALYTQRPWSRRLQRALGVLAGAVEALPILRAEYMAAEARRQTTAPTAAAWLEELVARRGPKAVTIWGCAAEAACRGAVVAYDAVRGDRPSAVPGADEDDA